MYIHTCFILLYLAPNKKSINKRPLPEHLVLCRAEIEKKQKQKKGGGHGVVELVRAPTASKLRFRRPHHSCQRRAHPMASRAGSLTPLSVSLLSLFILAPFIDGNTRFNI